MSRDFCFWKQEKKSGYANKDIYIALSNEKTLDYVCNIPVKEILDDIIIEFSGWNNDNNFFERDSEAFELMMTNQYVRIDCYNMKEESINKFIDIMIKYECPLYDPMIDVRFDGID